MNGGLINLVVLVEKTTSRGQVVEYGRPNVAGRERHPLFHGRSNTNMVYAELTADDVAELTPEALGIQYEAALAEIVDRVGSEETAERTDLDRERLSVLVDGGSPALTIEEVASILALDPDEPSAEAVHAELLDRLMIDMTTAVVDVETVAANVEGDRSPTEVQQQVEGRAPMTLETYARVRHFLASRAR